ncbi:O-antigen ligase family protein [Dellaglioa algida]|uniref:O-antigen ligase-related domain-containing protein n=1 Tax=Dellaglioa algida DSM 15638 TaxID=1423719 RepID=A0A0R1HHL9_9LACO|nr:O-antigen ligase family protein [Dellaglioa algida]KRK45512.1 hypothetical protein FC66_GL001327 [Dellaglioa algida DSM 15638]MDK1732057.1 O-antigen ligase family protein [Dellaglioa algida]MDK1733583.1 O-antigen ligase family protein [Dellaglioa algida]
MLKKDVKVPILFTLIVVELVLGGAGRLIIIGDNSISERYILFGLGMFYWIYNEGYKSQTSSSSELTKSALTNTRYSLHIILVFLMLMVAGIIGFFYSNSITNIIGNFQAYIFLLLFFPFASVIRTKEQALKVFNVFNECAVILSIFIIILNIALNAGYSYTILANFMEKYGLGLIGYSGTTPRVFFKGSILIMVAFGNQLLIIVNSYQKNLIRSSVKLVILGLATIFSYTMGIWLGAAVVLLIVLILQWRRLKMSTIVIGIIALLCVAYFEKDTIMKVFQLRTGSKDISSLVKKQQRQVLLNLWKSHPFFGMGLGKEVVLSTVMGTRVMSQFESAWIQLLMNTGIIGLFIYGSLIVRASYDGLLKLKNSDTTIRMLGLSIFLSMVSLSIVNWFNPVLNNPIGIGYLVISLTILNVIRVENNI